MYQLTFNTIAPKLKETFVTKKLLTFCTQTDKQTNGWTLADSSLPTKKLVLQGYKNVLGYMTQAIH